jgi:hypothetical protein
LIKKIEKKASIKDVQAPAEAFSPQKRTYSISKHEISKKKFYFPESGSGSTDSIESGSNSDPIPQPC